jgi:hypothetical protein
MLLTTLFLPLLFATQPEPDTPSLRINLDGMPMGISSLHRERNDPGSVVAYYGGVDVHVFPHAMHGFMLGVAGSTAVFGPSVVAFDAGYSLRFGHQGHHQGVTGDLVATIAPSIAMVSYSVDSASGASQSTSHAVIGARLSATVHIYLWKIALGLQLSYRGGVALRGSDGFSGALSAGPTLGFVIDP